MYLRTFFTLHCYEYDEMVGARMPHFSMRLVGNKVVTITGEPK